MTEPVRAHGVSVWAVAVCWPYEGCTTKGVFSSREKAEAFIGRMDIGSRSGARVDGWVLDDPDRDVEPGATVTQLLIQCGASDRRVDPRPPAGTREAACPDCGHTVLVGGTPDDPRYEIHNEPQIGGERG